MKVVDMLIVEPSNFLPIHKGKKVVLFLFEGL
jgi:hypothetical protein